MRIVVIGAGAIGSALGAKLAEAGHTVGLLGRPAYVDRVRRCGLTLVEAGRRRVVTDVSVSTQLWELAEALEGFELALVTAKAYDTEAACREVAPYVAAGLGRVVLVQNGVGGDEIAAGVLGKDRLISGVTTLVVARRGVAQFEVLPTRAGLGLAPVLALVQDVAPLVALFEGVGVRTHAYTDYRAMKWSKLLLNMLGNAVPTIVDLTPAEVYANPRLYALEVSAFREARRVMRASGIPPVALPGYPVPVLAALVERGPKWLLRRPMQRLVGGGRGGKRPSLQLDLESGRDRSEVAFLNGAVVREARRRGIAAPANEAIYEVLMQLISGQALREEFRHTPEALHDRARGKGWRA